MIKIAAIDKPVRLSGMTVGVGPDGKLVIDINPKDAIAQTVQSLIANMTQSLMPLVQQGIELPDVELPKTPPADFIEHVCTIVTYVAVQGLKKAAEQQKLAQAAAVAAANAAKPVQDDQGGIAPAANDVAGIEKATAGAATADSGAEPVAATADAAAAPASTPAAVH